MVLEVTINRGTTAPRITSFHPISSESGAAVDFESNSFDNLPLFYHKIFYRHLIDKTSTLTSFIAELQL